jgi:hypothetical protein
VAAVTGVPPFTVAALLADGRVAAIGSSPFTVTDQVSTVDGWRFAVRLEVTCVAQAPVDAGLRVELRLGPTEDPGWLVPGVFYRENRVPGCTARFPRFTTEAPDTALLESDAWSLRADRASTPAVFGWDRTGGAALVTGERSVLGQSGVGFAMSGDRPLLRLHFPYREEPVVYDGSPTPLPADTPNHRWAPGETVTLHFDVYRLGPDRHGYTDVLRDVHARTAPGDAGAVPWVSVAEAADLAAWGLYRWHYRPDPPVLLETAAFDRHALGERGDRQAMHVSWISGAPYAYALLRHGRRRGNPEYVTAARAVLDHIATNLAPGGTFWAQWTADRGWGAGWTPDSKRLHARTLGEAALFMGVRRTVQSGRRLRRAAGGRRARLGLPRRGRLGAGLGGHRRPGMGSGAGGGGRRMAGTALPGRRAPGRALLPRRPGTGVPARRPRGRRPCTHVGGRIPRGARLRRTVRTRR